MTSQLADIPILAQSSLVHEQVFETVLTHYRGKSRKNRQHAAAVIKEIALADPQKLTGIIPDLLDGLERPEAQTRWCTLEALELLLPYAPDECLEAFEGAEDALFDDKDGFLREKAFSFLCAIGRLSREQSERVWHLLDEAVQCYHGNPEFLSMLSALCRFAESDISDETKSALKNRLSFDANNSKGSIGKRAQQIIDIL